MHRRFVVKQRKGYGCNVFAKAWVSIAVRSKGTAELRWRWHSPTRHCDGGAKFVVAAVKQSATKLC